jgi:hypothetical protein
VAEGAFPPISHLPFFLFFILLFLYFVFGYFTLSATFMGRCWDDLGWAMAEWLCWGVGLALILCGG